MPCHRSALVPIHRAYRSRIVDRRAHEASTGKVTSDAPVVAFIPVTDNSAAADKQPLEPASDTEHKPEEVNCRTEELEDLRRRCLEIQAKLEESRQRCDELEEMCRDFQVTHLVQFLENQDRDQWNTSWREFEVIEKYVAETGLVSQPVAKSDKVLNIERVEGL
ncbi:hypothetical protein BDW59DRAFT_157835 [Aspergillus cavernicola]|uniref:Uncharacterized protein n=1 Tax=Aspergillus cavernicola TaxID=176166 RepID=A0ABR4IV09_9EURO